VLQANLHHRPALQDVQSVLPTHTPVCPPQQAASRVDRILFHRQGVMKLETVFATRALQKCWDRANCAPRGLIPHPATLPSVRAAPPTPLDLQAVLLHRTASAIRASPGQMEVHAWHARRVHTRKTAGLPRASTALSGHSRASLQRP
jgi:hypothetical protein